MYVLRQLRKYAMVQGYSYAIPLDRSLKSLGNDDIPAEMLKRHGRAAHAVVAVAELLNVALGEKSPNQLAIR
jgi:hypothetical protein